MRLLPKCLFPREVLDASVAARPSQIELEFVLKSPFDNLVKGVEHFFLVASTFEFGWEGEKVTSKMTSQVFVLLMNSTISTETM